MAHDTKNLEKKFDNQEQYFPWNWLLIYRVKEDINEDIDKLPFQLIQDNLEVDVNIDDLDRTHRIGSSKISNGIIRMILLKFARYNVRWKVFSNKKTLKSKTIIKTFKTLNWNSARSERNSS